MLRNCSFPSCRPRRRSSVFLVNVFLPNTESRHILLYHWLSFIYNVTVARLVLLRQWQWRQGAPAWGSFHMCPSSKRTLTLFPQRFRCRSPRSIDVSGRILDRPATCWSRWSQRSRCRLENELPGPLLSVLARVALLVLDALLVLPRHRRRS